MKSIKVFYNGEPLRNIYPHATKWQVLKYRVSKFMRKVLIVSSTVTVGGWLVFGGIAYEKATAVVKIVKAEVKVEVPVDEPSPVMDRIADCESGDRDKNGRGITGTARQIDPKTGQVYMKTNTDGSIDVGYLMINSVNFRDATNRGFDVTKEKDNRAYGLYLYKNRGTEPWYSSKACWSK